MNNLNSVLRKFIWIPYIVLFSATIQLSFWVVDREPPVAIKSAIVVPPVTPGSSLRVEATVKRDLSRECDVLVNHWVQDVKGYRYYFPNVEITSDSIKRLEQLFPGFTKYTVELSKGAAVGKAVYHSELNYSCNPFHKFIYPIKVVYTVPFMIEEGSNE